MKKEWKKQIKTKFFSRHSKKEALQHCYFSIARWLGQRESYTHNNEIEGERD